MVAMGIFFKAKKTGFSPDLTRCAKKMFIGYRGWGGEGNAIALI